MIFARPDGNVLVVRTYSFPLMGKSVYMGEVYETYDVETGTGRAVKWPQGHRSNGTENPHRYDIRSAPATPAGLDQLQNADYGRRLTDG